MKDEKDYEVLLALSFSESFLYRLQEWTESHAMWLRKFKHGSVRSPCGVVCVFSGSLSLSLLLLFISLFNLSSKLPIRLCFYKLFTAVDNFVRNFLFEFCFKNSYLDHTGRDQSWMSCGPRC